MTAEPKPVSTAVNEADARRRLNELAAKWPTYGSIPAVRERAWAESVPFLAFSDHIREVVCTTNAIESLNARYRRAATACGHFPNGQAALNEFDQLFDGRLAAGRVQSNQTTTGPIVNH
ncbi:hypothetical protein KSE_45490 [Kitasatospora setae KM-6054]|uniref:Mutator family transposase n=1 Tax=Kitasatospora setae (strain ATCC 33774 / DSM 43861 / JCM 3304 / KCC A-0304 / NBRC 14216 / KM-6054) TaxID=452652 RepID=E4NFQ1_KITSK|nr:hypothetical protein KSE_45490 [Kitasatospora setae KM-6054]